MKKNIALLVSITLIDMSGGSFLLGGDKGLAYTSSIDFRYCRVDRSVLSSIRRNLEVVTVASENIEIRILPDTMERSAYSEK